MRGGPSIKGVDHAAKHEWPDVRAARKNWFERQPDLDPDRLVFLDETAATTKMARRYGRASRGPRCGIAVPHGHDKTTTITAALRATSLIAKDRPRWSDQWRTRPNLRHPHPDSNTQAR